MSKQMTYGDQSREAILREINSLTNAVKVTLGPRGRHVILDRPFGSPTITKDGVTVAKEISVKDPIENIGWSDVGGQYEQATVDGAVRPGSRVERFVRLVGGFAGVVVPLSNITRTFVGEGRCIGCSR